MECVVVFTELPQFICLRQQPLFICVNHLKIYPVGYVYLNTACCSENNLELIYWVKDFGISAQLVIFVSFSYVV